MVKRPPSWRPYPCGFGPLPRNPLDDVTAEFRHLVAERQEILEGCRIAVGLDFFEAIPLLNDNARFRRFSFDRGGLASGGKEFAAGRFDRDLSFRDVVLQVGLNDLVHRATAPSPKPASIANVTLYWV